MSLPHSAAPIARTPEPPYYAVLFTSVRHEVDEAGYAAMAAEMDALARRQPGFLGVESVRDQDRVGITVSYWRDEAAIRAWKNVADHLGAQRMGRERWYAHYTVRIARIERRVLRQSQAPEVHIEDHPAEVENPVDEE